MSLGSSQANGSDATETANSALLDNESATVQACAWGTVCVTGTLVGVPADSLRAVMVSGDGQVAPAGATLAAVVVRVVDAAAHPVAGAAVTVYQQVTGWQPPCLSGGRCAVPPVYGTSTTSGMSDDDGLISITPLAYVDTAAVTAITVSVGTVGTVTATLQKSP